MERTKLISKTYVESGVLSSYIDSVLQKQDLYNKSFKFCAQNHIS